MIAGRDISSYEKGLLTGVGIGAVVGPSITLVIFLLIICYDLGRPQLVDVGQRALNRILDITEPQVQPQPSQIPQDNVILTPQRSTLSPLPNSTHGANSMSQVNHIQNSAIAAVGKMGMNLVANAYSPQIGNG
jgi:hypothetical protein